MAKEKTAPQARKSLSGAREFEAFEEPEGAEKDLSTTTGESSEGTPPSGAARGRVYRNTQKIDHDLFKLEVAKMKKNVSYIEESPEYVDVEHTHFFHSVDSYGKKQFACTAVGGHHHDVEVLPAPPGAVPQIRVSGPKRMVRQKRKGVMSAPLDFDNHTHEVTYMGSEIVKMREMNAEFAKLESTVQAKINPSTVEGVL